MASDVPSRGHLLTEYGCGGLVRTWVARAFLHPPWLASSMPPVNSTLRPMAELTEAYKEYGNSKKYKADWTDITRGINGYACKKGWDFCTGIGSPKTLNGK